MRLLSLGAQGDAMIAVPAALRHRAASLERRLATSLSGSATFAFEGVDKRGARV
jgi:hypothetical protein